MRDTSKKIWDKIDLREKEAQKNQSLQPKLESPESKMAKTPIRNFTILETRKMNQRAVTHESPRTWGTSLQTVSS